MIKTFIRKLVLLLVLLTVPATVQAHPGHANPNPADAAVVVNNATNELRQIITSGMRIEGEKLDLTWTNFNEGQVVKQGPGYYIISFTSPTQPKTIYVLMSDTGYFYNANFSGKFEGID